MTETCVFCAIAQGESPARVTYQDADILAFEDIAPMAPFHELVIPRRHIVNLAAADDGDQGLLGKLMLVARHRAAEAGHSRNGFRVVMNSGRDGHQTVGHVHLHLLAGRALAWPPG